MSKDKILFIAPHLSTGGLPQYLAKKIELLKDSLEVFCVEYTNITGGVLVVQRNKITSMLDSDHFFSLGDDKDELLSIIDRINPEYIHMEEMPEYFCDHGIANKIYSLTRKYKIFETSHDNSFNPNQKVYFPDKFIFVSAYQKQHFSSLNIPSEVVEYPIEYRTPNKVQCQIELGFNPEWKHVIHVGLFTPRKNQAEVFEYARMLKDEKIMFHFVGNHADNFKFYWDPLMKDVPENCVIWGERSDVDKFYQAADLFLFTSKGSSGDIETSPLVIRESIGWECPILIYNLPTYLGMYDTYPTVSYLDADINKNKEIILNKLIQKTLVDKLIKATEIVGDKRYGEANLIINENWKVYQELSDKISFTYENDNNKINFSYTGDKPYEVKISVKDMVSGAPIYWFPLYLTPQLNYFIIPIPAHIFKFHNNKNFRGFNIEFYDNKNNLLFYRELIVNDFHPNIPKFNFLPFDCNFVNYYEFFVYKCFDNLDFDNLDCVVDIGANIGLFSKYIKQRGGKDIFMVEANPNLSNNIDSVMGDDREGCTLFNKPIFSEKRKMKFNYPFDNTTIGELLFSDNPKYDTVIETETITISELFNNIGDRRISLFKSDIEGGEYDLFKSITNDQIKQVDQFLIEFHKNTNNEIDIILNRLIDSGYEFELFEFKLDHKVNIAKTDDHGFILAKPKNKNESIKPNIQFPEQAFVSFTNETYLPLAEKLVKSILLFSKYPIILYTINCDANFSYPNLYIKRIDDENIRIPKYIDSGEYNFRKGEYFDVKVDTSKNNILSVDRNDINTYITLSRKGEIISDVLKCGVQKGIFLDSDGIVKENIDTIFSYFNGDTNYPLVSKGVFEYMVLNGKGYPANGDVLEYPLMNLLNVKERTMHYVSTNFILFTDKMTNFFNDLKELSNNSSILENPFEYAPFQDETLINVLLWKYNATKHLPIVHFNLIDSNKAIEFYNIDKTNITLDTDWQYIPEDKNDIKFFHGCKSIDELDKTLNYIVQNKINPFIYKGSKNSKIAILTLYDDHYLGVSSYSIKNKKEYADKWGYDLIYFDDVLDKSRPPQWSKVLAIHYVLKNYDWVWWIDIDAFITNFNIKLEDIIDSNFDMIFTKNKESFISNGSSFFKNSILVNKFLGDVYNLKEIDIYTFDHEQKAMRMLLQNDDKYLTHTKLIDEKVCNSYYPTNNKDVLKYYPDWNVSSNLWEEGDFIVQFCGRTTEEKNKDMIEFYKKINK